MSRKARNEALWRLAVEIEAKEKAPASQRDCGEVQELRKRFHSLIRQRNTVQLFAFGEDKKAICRRPKSCGDQVNGPQ